MRRNEQSVWNEVEGFVGRTWRDVEAFLKQTGIRASALGRSVAHDPNLVRQIRAGERELTLKMAMRLAHYIAEHRENSDRSVPA